MANRYWVGGAGTWDATTTTHWSASSGGAGGASVPTLSDDVYFDASSGIGTINIYAGIVNCNNITVSSDINLTSITGTRGSSILRIYGSATLQSIVDSSEKITFNFLSTSTGNTIDFNNSRSFVWEFGSSTGGWTILSSAGSGSYSYLDVPQGTIIIGADVSILGGIVMYDDSTSAIDLSSYTLTTNYFEAYSGTDITAGTSTIVMAGNGQQFLGGGKTYNNLTLNAPSVSGSDATISGSNTFNALTIAAGAGVKFTAGATQTISSLVADGSTGTIYFYSSTSGTQYTLAFGASGTATVQYVDVQDCIATGTNTPINDRIGGVDSGNNSGWSFPFSPFPSGHKVQYSIPTGTLSTGTTYYWRVRAKDPAGSATWGDWSEVQSFTVGQGIVPSGLPSTLLFGSATVSPGPVGIVSSAIGPSVALGSPTVISLYGINPVGINPTEALGVPTIFFQQFIAPEGIVSLVAFGAARLISWQFLPLTNVVGTTTLSDSASADSMSEIIASKSASVTPESHAMIEVVTTNAPNQAVTGSSSSVKVNTKTPNTTV